MARARHVLGLDLESQPRSSVLCGHYVRSCGPANSTVRLEQSCVLGRVGSYVPGPAGSDLWQPHIYFPPGHERIRRRGGHGVRRRDLRQAPKSIWHYSLWQLGGSLYIEHVENARKVRRVLCTVVCGSGGSFRSTF